MTLDLHKNVDKLTRRVYKEVLREVLKDNTLNSVLEIKTIKKLLRCSSARVHSYVQSSNIENKKAVLKALIKYRNKNYIKYMSYVCKVDDRCVKQLKKIKNCDIVEYLLNNIYLLARYKANTEKIKELFYYKDLEKITIYNVLQEMRIAESYGNVFIYIEELISTVKKKYKHKINDIKQALSKLSHENIIYEEDDKIYFTEYYEAELTLALNIKQRLNTNVHISEQIKNKIYKYIEREDNTYKFNDEQIEAIYNVFYNNISLITGSAGTGKSTLIGNIIRCIKSVYSDTVKVALVSFTGKAVTRLNTEDTNITATTIHRFLNLTEDDNKYEVKSKVFDVDFLIVDEASMVDLRLIDVLFNSLKEDTKIVLVGDVCQLEPVGAGTPFLDLFNSNNIAKTELHTIYRQKQNSVLLDNANLIRESNYDDIKYSDEFKIIECKHDNDILDKVTEQINALKEDGYNLDDIAILAQSNKLVNEINNMISHSVSENNFIQSDLFNINDKVIQNVNNYEKNVFNGETGKITSIESFKDKYTIKVKFNYKDKEVIYNNEEINQLRLAYAMTVNKSQGSEYKAVIIVIDSENIKKYDNKRLYVSVTRAKEKDVIIAKGSSFKKAVLNKGKVRNGYLLERIEL